MSGALRQFTARKPAVVFADDFNRSDEALITSSDWAVRGDDLLWNVESEKLLRSTLALSHQTAYHTSPVATDNVYTQLRLAGRQTSSSVTGGPAVRVSSDGMQSIYAGHANATGLYVIRSHNNGTEVTLASTDLANGTPAGMYRIELNGDTVRFLLDGTEILSAETETYAGNAYTGITVFRRSHEFDDFETGIL